MREVSSTVGTAAPDGATRIRPGADLVLHQTDGSGERPCCCSEAWSLPGAGASNRGRTRLRG